MFLISASIAYYCLLERYKIILTAQEQKRKVSPPRTPLQQKKKMFGIFDVTMEGNCLLTLLSVPKAVIVIQYGVTGYY